MNGHGMKHIVAFALVAIFGCQYKGFDLEFHAPLEVERFEIKIDKSSGMSPRRVGGRVYAIDLDHLGKATINSDWPMARFHREFIVTPTSRLQKNKDYEVVDSGWEMNKTTRRSPGFVTSKTQVDGSVFWMQIRKKQHPQDRVEQGRLW